MLGLNFFCGSLQLNWVLLCSVLWMIVLKTPEKDKQTTYRGVYYSVENNLKHHKLKKGSKFGGQK